jgi:hypothetical protein
MALQAGFDSDVERKDMYTLTQPEYAFWAGKGYKTFHTRNCQKLSGVQHLVGFKRFSDAVRAHYQPCKHCNPTAKSNVKFSIPIQNEKREGDNLEDLRKLCEKNGMIFKEEGSFAKIVTSIGIWEFNIFKRPIEIFHINLKCKFENKLKKHRQLRLFLSYYDVFEYIERHDGELIKKVKKGDIFVAPCVKKD